MSENAQKSIELLLNGTKSPQGIAIKMLAKMLDEMSEDSKNQHVEVMGEIRKLTGDTDGKFKSIEVVSFLSSHPGLFWLVVASIVLLTGVASIDNVVKILQFAR